MKAYSFLSRVPVIKNSLSLKVLLVAFIGIHVPLFGIIGYLLNSELAKTQAWNVALFTFFMTILATIITLIVLNKLLKPVILAKEALLQFKEYSKIPDLPTDYQDEGGVLMREVQQTIESLSRIEEERENILHILRHDLQGPINSSLAVLELVKTDLLDEQTIEKLQSNFHVQLNRLLTSIDYIKSQRNLQEQKNSLERVSLKNLISSAIGHVHYEADIKKIEFQQTEIPNEKVLLPLVILDRVMTNLLDNAIKYSEKGGRVVISSAISEGVLKIDIKDFGEGLKPEILSSLFHISKSDREDYDIQNPSMGLGLYLCQKLMNSVGGRIIAKNNQKEPGATFGIEYVINGIEK
ncbi:sensor histidine kinase [Algoriphagus sediminis]|uniref:histidine kinase n=1 Tax=Algoriphagus sediminis TaxID=3057113 RepID=A0ABT7YA90_9BACT|nr:HAMP domain-containing sensor histidine kinase [Algoriphagus sediminis]MDN3203325.1 HAMP domain-containing sensor histidine kinase [Algoriphagus sediminis]